jgi:hypothetical protein
MRWVTRNLTLLLLLPLSGCHSAEERAKRQLEAQQRQEAARAVTYLKTHYNAVIDWPQELAGKTFTIDVGPIFLRADHRPILFYAMLEDVRQENNGTFLYFRRVCDSFWTVADATCKRLRNLQMGSVILQSRRRSLPSRKRSTLPKMHLSTCCKVSSSMLGTWANTRWISFLLHNPIRNHRPNRSG